jgi:hypothetical protein
MVSLGHAMLYGLTDVVMYMTRHLVCLVFIESSHLKWRDLAIFFFTVLQVLS